MDTAHIQDQPIVHIDPDVVVPGKAVDHVVSGDRPVAVGVGLRIPRTGIVGQEEVDFGGHTEPIVYLALCIVIGVLAAPPCIKGQEITFIASQGRLRLFRIVVHVKAVGGLIIGSRVFGTVIIVVA